MKERIKKWIKKCCKKLSVGLAASAKLEKSNPKMRVAAATTVIAIVAATANAQTYYSTYNNTENYYSDRETFANQNTGGYTYNQPNRSDSWFIQSIFGILGGIRSTFGGATRDPWAHGGPGSVPGRFGPKNP